MCVYLPTVDANHNQTWEVETDTTRYDRIGWRQVQRTGGIPFTIVFHD